MAPAGTEFVVETKAGDRFTGILDYVWVGTRSGAEDDHLRMFTFHITEGHTGQPTRLDPGDRYSVVDSSIEVMRPR